MLLEMSSTRLERNFSMSNQSGFNFTSAAKPLDPSIKWAGGKRWLVPEFAKFWASHQHQRLVEPSCGAAAITLGIRPASALLNDINPHLMNFHRWLQRGFIIEIPMVNEQTAYYAHRTRFNALVKAGCTNDKELAELFYYLNRNGFNGLCRFNQSGEFNVPFGKYSQIDYRRDFTEYRTAYTAWTLTVGHFMEVALEPEDFIYADPPYDGDDGAFVGYAGIPFDWQDQVRLAQWLAQHAGPVVASNAATPRIMQLYRELGFTLSERQVGRAINCRGDKRKSVAEMLATKNL
jgi:DNA adenine methylase